MTVNIMSMIMENNNLKPEIGMGCTILYYTDRHAATIIGVSKSGKVVTVQEDKAIRTDKNGMSESQSYRYERDTNGKTQTFSLRKNGIWRARKSTHPTLHIGDKNHYHDYLF